MTVHNEQIRYRVATPDDQDFINDMNVVASYYGRRPDAKLPDTDDFLELVPRAAVYSQGFGRTGDLGIIAVDSDGRSVGAVWGREYDRSDDDHAMQDHPFEVTMALTERMRGRGIGRQLLTSFGSMAWIHGRDEIALGVHERNPAARHLYESIGYAPLLDDTGVEVRMDEEYTPMVQVLKPQRTTNNTDVAAGRRLWFE